MRKYINIVESLQLVESKSHPIIVVDVQPAYDNKLNSKIINFVHNQTGPKLMFVNADRDGLTDDTIDSIKQYWEEEVGYADSEDDGYYESAIDWNTYTIVDKGYGYFRDWMDQGIDEHVIIRVIRLMYQQQVSDSRMLFGGEDSDEYTTELEKILDGNDLDFCANNPISIYWTNVAQLKKFSGAYIVGGAKDECLREVELLMSAFNIKYKRINSLVY